MHESRGEIAEALKYVETTSVLRSHVEYEALNGFAGAIAVMETSSGLRELKIT